MPLYNISNHIFRYKIIFDHANTISDDFYSFFEQT